MSLPTALAKHIHVSERESAHKWPDGRSDDGKWEDCAWCAFLMWLRLAYRPDLPATHAFMESIRARVMGPLGGTIPAQLIAGAKTIGVSGPGTAGIVLKSIAVASVWAAMKPGTVCLANGSMGAFPAGDPMRRFGETFASLHSVLAVRLDSQDRVWWDDPQAPTMFLSGDKYAGQWVSKDDFLRFVAKLDSSSFVAPIKGYQPPVVVVPSPAPITYTQAQLDAALAACRATDKAALDAAVADATRAGGAAERLRIKTLLGF